MDALNSIGDQQTDGRRESFGSHNSQTAREYEPVSNVHSRHEANNHRFIESQLQLEADAREVLPYVSSSIATRHVCTS
jgi:hypothetical protein